MIPEAWKPSALRQALTDWTDNEASHLSQPATDTAELNPETAPLTLDQTESFCDYLDSKGDTLAPPDSFDQWLRQTDDSI